MSRADDPDVALKLQALPLLDGIDQETRDRLVQGVSFRVVAANDLLFGAAQPAPCCYVVSYGAIKLWRQAPQEKEMIMHFCESGDFIAAAIMIHAHPKYPVNATAMEDSGLFQIPRETYLESWNSQPQIARKMNLQIMSRVMEFHDDKVMTASPVPQKIAHFLLRTVDAQSPIYGNRIRIKLTRRNIAERVGTTVETVIRILSKWSQSGWIHIEDQHIDILNRQAFEELLK